MDTSSVTEGTTTILLISNFPEDVDQMLALKALIMNLDSQSGDYPNLTNVVKALSMRTIRPDFEQQLDQINHHLVPSGSIGVVRTARGQGGVLDIEQCRRRFSVATQIESIFAEAPRYKPRCKRSTIEDNMTPADAGTCRLPINLQPNWDAGLKLAQDDLGSDLTVLFTEGVALFVPKGCFAEAGVATGGR